MIVILPTSLMAQDPTRGMLHSDGGTWLNGSQAPLIAAVFPDSIVQTRVGHTSRIDVAGSSVLILPETETQFQGDALVLTHGGLQLVTTTKMQVLVGCMNIIPTTSDRTEYDVTDVDGKAKIVVSKNAVSVHSQNADLWTSKQGTSHDTIVHEAGQLTRGERCDEPPKPEKRAGGSGPILNSWWAIGAGIAVVGALACLGLCHGDDPISPYKP